LETGCNDVPGPREGAGRCAGAKTPYASPTVDIRPPKEEEIRGALARVLASPGFARNERLSKFLGLLIDRHLEGRDAELKESVLAVEVFGRKAGYDPKLDAVVRTEAIRLRARLEKYYQEDGRGDPLIIELPKGGYRPVFRERSPAAEPQDAPTAAAPVVREPRRRTVWWIAGVAAALVAALGTTWLFIQSTPRSVSIAVLPLKNLSNDPATDYFADGLTDEIIRNLSVIEGLTVRSRTSSFALKGKVPGAIEAGRQLGADFLVEGSVLLAGDQLRVNAALVGARDGARIWSNRYDRKLTDVFAIQDEISRGIVDTLRLRLSGRRRYEANLEAYDLYLRGRQIMAGFPSRSRPIVVQALEYFQRAIDKDPNYAIAYAGIADAYIAVERNMGAANPVNAGPRARDAAARAIELDPMLSEAHTAMASIRAREYAWAEAERGFRRAIELNPNNALAHLELGARVLVVQGRFEDGFAEVGRALTLDPLSPYAMTESGEALLLARRYAEAVERFRKAIALDPTRNRPYNSLARALYLQGNVAEATTAREQSLNVAASPFATDWMACLEVRAGRHDKAVAVLDQLRRSDRLSRALARAHACLGNREEALVFLEKAVAENEPGLPELLHAPELDFLRADARFAALRRKLNLQP
jgi:TolB-like protein/Tfp pilus assembly protein PilF